VVPILAVSMCWCLLSEHVCLAWSSLLWGAVDVYLFMSAFYLWLPGSSNAIVRAQPPRILRMCVCVWMGVGVGVGLGVDECVNVYIHTYKVVTRGGPWVRSLAM
jgi:hypothetical protein